MIRQLARALLLAGGLVSPHAALAACAPLLDQTMPTLMSGDASLCQYQGKVLLVVNTASRCGFTPQYEGLEKLYRRYREKGLVVLGFPSNDFGAQEPGSSAEIASFCQINYGVTFPMFAKSSVAQGAVNPFYARLAKASGSRPQWNFHKYLVDRRGERVYAYPSEVTPSDPKLIAEIERQLAAQ